MTLVEDCYQTRTGVAPSLPARAVLSLMDCVGMRNLPRQMRFFGTHLDQALALLFIEHCSVF